MSGNYFTLCNIHYISIDTKTTDFYIVLDTELPPRIEASMSVGNCIAFYVVNKINYDYLVLYIIIYNPVV